MVAPPGTVRATPFAVEAVEFPIETWAAFETQVLRLLALAKALTEDGAACVCRSGTACRSADAPGGTRACRLASELAAAAPDVSGIELPDGDLRGHYQEALREATPAVYLCRRVLHAGNRCWFGPGGGASSTCGRVLAAAHSLQQVP